ncbi:hypothetical protein HJA98_23250 [Rhizobium binae]|nr:hypothetical protein [Rhizobium binae]
MLYQLQFQRSVVSADCVISQAFADFCYRARQTLIAILCAFGNFASVCQYLVFGRLLPAGYVLVASADSHGQNAMLGKPI